MKFKEIVDLKQGDLFHEGDGEGRCIFVYLVLNNDSGKEMISVLSAHTSFESFFYAYKGYRTLSQDCIKLGRPIFRKADILNVMSNLKRIEGDVRNFFGVLENEEKKIK